MSADYSFYATLCGYMPRPEGVQKGKDESLSLFCAPLGNEALESPPFQGGWEGVNSRAHDCLLQVAQSSP